MSIIKVYQPSKGSCKVTFTYPVISGHSVKSVQVLGDFNNWDSKIAPKMKKGKDEFTTVIELNAGKSYEFRYLLDGIKWDNDFSADNYIASPYSGINNSVLVLESGKGSKVKKEKTVAPKAAKVAAPKAAKVAAPKAAKVAAPKEAKVAAPKEAKVAAPKAAKVAAPKAAKVAAPKEAKVAAPKEAKVAAPKAAKVAAPKEVKVAAPKVAKVAAPKAAKVAAPKTAKVAAPKAAKVAAPKVAKVANVKVVKDDLKKIEGIGPKIADLLVAKGIITFADLSQTSSDTLKNILDGAGSKYKMHDPSTWAKQASLAANGNWDALKKLQDELNGGKVSK